MDSAASAEAAKRASGRSAPRPPLAGRAFLSRSASATRALAAALSALLPPGALLRLEGPLGAGKTTFVQGLALGLGLDEAPRSPSFGLLHVYGAAGEPALVHLDLYRLASASELRDLGLDAYLEGPAPIAIEWAQRAEGALPVEGLRVTLQPAAMGAPDEGDGSALGGETTASRPERGGGEASAEASPRLPASAAPDPARRISFQALDPSSAARLAAWQPPSHPELSELPPALGEPDLPTPELEDAEPLGGGPPPARLVRGGGRSGAAAPAAWKDGPVLALDTATEQAAVAIVAADGQVLARQAWLSRRRHTVELAPTVAELMAGAGLGAADLAAVAVTLGPGSYTGLRIALALAKGIALAWDLPVVGVPTLDLVAADPSLSARMAAPVAPAAGPGTGSGSVGLWAFLAAGRGRYLAARYPWPGDVPVARTGNPAGPSPEPSAYPGGRRPADWPEPTAARPLPPEALAALLAPGDLAVGELGDALLAELGTRGIAVLPLARDPWVLARLARQRLRALAAGGTDLSATAPLAPLYAA